MIINQIQIEKLHGNYDYKIDFFRDITFLYGANGCGKTTILNILTSIVTGKLYDLVDYLLSRVQLICSDEKGSSSKIVIRIVNKKTIRNMTVQLNDDELIIEDIDNLKERIYRKAEDDEFENAFFEAYPVARKLKEQFNYIYLPLSRYGNEMFSEREIYRYRRHYMFPMINSYKTYLNTSLQYVSELIKNNCLNINIQENKINDKFRNDVVSESLSVSDNIQIGQIIKDIENCKWEDVLKSKDAYVTMLQEIEIYDAKLESKLEEFFMAFKNAYDDYQSKKRGTNNQSIRIDLAWQYAEFLKIRKIVDLARENEKKKNHVRKPKETFLNVINGFFESSGTDKKMSISSDGQVEFSTDNRKIRLSELSSGEKQIIITFASLVFGLSGNSTGVFIIDEPESSLHLEWQLRFVPSIVGLNKKIQLIFATHSPEIIGKYRENAIELIKE